MKNVAMIVILTTWCAVAHAQAIDVGVESVHDRIDYHFNNASRWDTPFLVPHFFEQTYSAAKRLLIIRIRGDFWTFEGGVTGVQSGKGSDYDTFFQPGGDVVVHGHMTDVNLRSWRAAETLKISKRWHARLAYSRDQFRHPPSFSITTHTQPQSSVNTFSDTRESTASDIVDLAFGVSEAKDVHPRLRVRGTLDVSPFTVARLTTYLPDQHPGEAFRFSAGSFSARGLLSARWQIGRAAFILSGQLAHGWRYSPRSSFTRQQSGATLTLGWNAGGRSGYEFW